LQIPCYEEETHNQAAEKQIETEESGDTAVSSKLHVSIVSGYIPLVIDEYLFWNKFLRAFCSHAFRLHFPAISSYNMDKVRYSDTLSQTPSVLFALEKNRAKYGELIRRSCTPLSPVPTGVHEKFTLLPSIKAVLFDIYGTLLISASGEVGSSTRKPTEIPSLPRFHAAVSEAGFVVNTDPERLNEACNELYIGYITSRHRQLRKLGISYPEVDILSIWHRLLTRMLNEQWISGSITVDNLIFTALLFELDTNRTWPMPGTLELTRTLKHRGITTGIVSNAQFYTPYIFETLIGCSLTEAGFSPQAMSWSYLHGYAKPSVELFSGVIKFIQNAGIKTNQVIYIGNDMLNDISTAAELGLRTVLFAGDRRSLRLRKENQQLQTCQPDAIITELRQLIRIIDGESNHLKE
jgi:putative hydrolase of the HAD superfamily